MVDRIKSIMAHYQLRAAQFSDAIGMQRSVTNPVLILSYGLKTGFLKLVLTG